MKPVMPGMITGFIAIFLNCLYGVAAQGNVNLPVMLNKA